MELSGKKGKRIESGERKTILDVYKQFQKSCPGESVSSLVKKTKEATGVSERSIYRLKKDEEKGKVLTPKKTRRSVEYNTSRSVKYDGNVISALTRIVHSFVEANTRPTLAGVLARVNEDADLPNFKRTTLWRLLKDSGVCFEKRSKSAQITGVEDKLPEDADERLRVQLSWSSPSERSSDGESVSEAGAMSRIEPTSSDAISGPSTRL